MRMAAASFSYPSHMIWNGERAPEVHIGFPADDEMMHGTGRQSPAEIRFRGFVLIPGERLLLRDGRPVELGSRAFDLLRLLACSRGSIVSKEEIFDHVWPTTTVEESNLRLQVAALRKMLGRDRDLIKTVPGRGYLFISETGLPTDMASPPPVLAVAARDGMAGDGLQSLLSRLQAVTGAGRGSDLSLPVSGEACEMLRTLLHSVLDEMWELALRGEARPARYA